MSTTGNIVAKLDALRGGAKQRRPNVRTLAAFADHTDCQLAAMAFAAQVDLDSALAGTRFQQPFGQSPFAIARGQQFERRLAKDNYAPLVELITPELALPPGARALDLRALGLDKNGRRNFDDASQTGRQFLLSVFNKEADAPHLLGGLVLAADICGRRAFFEADSVAASSQGVIRTGEIKSFPVVDGRADSGDLASAVDQLAVYTSLLKNLAATSGFDPDEHVSTRALLITPKNVGLSPVVSMKEIGPRVSRVRRLLQKLPSDVDCIISGVPEGVGFGSIADAKTGEPDRLECLAALTDAVDTQYKDSCLSSCGLGRWCRYRAHKTGKTCAAGSMALRLLPGVESLGRAAELTRGAKPNLGEAAVAAQLTRAGQLFDRFASPKAATR